MEVCRAAEVSAVIPTRNRPQMVVAAIESVLAQSEGLLEVIVVVDGPDPATVAALAAFEAAKTPAPVRVVALAEPVGGGEARNLGVRHARGAWIAFLDDDDLWLPNKLSVQLDLAAQSRCPDPVIASAVLARGPRFETIWPRRCYQAGQPMAEYLFCRQGWNYGAALLQTSTLLARRALLVRVPFEAGLKKHQDWDWLLRVSVEPGVEIRQSPEPLAIFHVEGSRTSVGRKSDWRYSLRWAREKQALFTPRAFAAFVATECAPQAGRAGASLRERVYLVRSMWEQGAPTWELCLLCLAFLLVPQALRRAVRDAVLVPGRQPALGATGQFTG